MSLVITINILVNPPLPIMKDINININYIINYIILLIMKDININIKYIVM